MNNINQKLYDVLVIGGGPAGTTVASLLAEKGCDVCVLEKYFHPRFHIGESLLPMNLPILDKLGVLEQVDAIGVKKYAAEFNSLVTDLTQDIFYFSKAMNEKHPYAYQVKRSEFDQILFANCQSKGVSTFEGMTVMQVDLDGPIKEIIAVDQSNAKHEFTGRYLIDASGRDTVLARQLNCKRKNTQHQMAAVYGHYHNVGRRTAKNEGNISIYWFQQGWIWMIPLQDGMMSVGLVCWPSYLKTRTGALELFLLQALQSVPDACGRMAGARLDGKVHATGNYSYCSELMSGEGFLLIGDAYSFVDPVFSSGVYLAMQSAVRAADLVEKLLNTGAQSKKLIKQFEISVQQEIKAFCWFIYRFNSPALHKLLMSSDEVSQHPVKQKLKAAVISVLAGDAYNNRQIKLPLWAFKVLYHINYWLELKQNMLFTKFRKQQNTAD